MKVQVKRGERNARQQGTEKEEEAHACAQEPVGDSQPPDGARRPHPSVEEACGRGAKYIEFFN